MELVCEQQTDLETESEHDPGRASRSTHHDLVVHCLHRARHLDYGHAQVAPDPEGDQEADRGEQGDLVALRDEKIAWGALLLEGPRAELLLSTSGRAGLPLEDGQLAEDSACI